MTTVICKYNCPVIACTVCAYEQHHPAEISRLRDTQPQHDEIDALWATLTNSYGATGDLLTGVLTLTQTMKAVLRHVDELQGEVSELKASLKGEN